MTRTGSGGSGSGLRITIAFVALLLIAFLPSAQAGERRFVERDRDSGAVSPSASSRHASMTLRVANWEPKIAKQREHAEKGTPTPPKERKPLTLFHFNQKGVGEISVQPVVGQINGAQMQMSF